MSDKLKNIFKSDPCLTAEELTAYAEGQLSGQDLHRAERHLLDCEMCSDALEGIRLQGSAKFRSTTDELNRKIEERINQPARIISIFTIRRMAAVVLVLLIASGTGYYISRMKREKLFSEYYEPYKIPDDSIAPKENPKEEEPVANQMPAPGASVERPVLSEVEGSRSKVEGSKSESQQLVSPEARAVGRRSEGLLKKQTAVDTKQQEENSLNEKGKKVADNNMDDVKEDIAIMHESKDKTTVTGNTAAAVQKDETYSPPTELNKTEEIVNYTEGKATRTKSLSKTQAPRVAEPVEAAGEIQSIDRMAQFDLESSNRILLKQAILEYDSGKYELAFNHAEKFLNKNPQDAEGLFYSGVSALSIHKEKIAAQRLKRCLDTGSQKWMDQATWYLALSYIRLGKKSEAKSLLQSLSTGTTERAAEARKMLESLE